MCRRSQRHRWPVIARMYIHQRSSKADQTLRCDVHNVMPSAKRCLENLNGYSLLRRYYIVNNRIATFTPEVTLHGEPINTHVYVNGHIDRCLFSTTRLWVSRSSEISLNKKLCVGESATDIFGTSARARIHVATSTFLCQQVAQRRVSCSPTKLFARVSMTRLLAVLRATC